MTARLRTILLAALLATQSVAAVVAQSLPALTAPVNDFAGVLDAPSAAALDERIRSLLAATGDTIVVVTVETIEPYGSIEEYAVRLFEDAGIGDRELDRGLLVLVSVGDRQVRIEVGYGLEDIVPDGYAGDVIRQHMLPAFRDNAYGAGVLAGVTTLVRRIAERRGVEIEGLPPPASTPDTPISRLQVLLVILVIIALLSLGSGGGTMTGGRRHRRYGGMGGFGGGFGGFGGGVGGFGGGFGGRGGGFGGFGGGMSGGGGASGRW